MSARNRRPVHHAAPPMVALVVSSPALVGAANGSTPPLHALAIVAVALSVAWIGAALGVRLTAATVSPTARPGVPSPPDTPAAAGPLGRIEPARVPVDQAIPGTGAAAGTSSDDAAQLDAVAPAATGGPLP